MVVDQTAIEEIKPYQKDFDKQYQNYKSNEKVDINLLEEQIIGLLSFSSEIRESASSGLNQRISELLCKGIVKLPVPKLCPCDPATEKAYSKHLARVIEENMDK